MSNLGIQLSVDARQVEQARKNIEALNGSLQQTESLGNLGIDDRHLSNVAGLVVKIREDIRRMQSIAAEGNRKGGLVDVKQLGEAGKISERLLETFGAYIGKVSLARDELKKLTREKDVLLKKEQELGRLDPFEKQRLGMLDERISTRQRIVNRHSEQADVMRMRLNAANEDLGGFGVQGPGGDFNAFLAGAGLGPAVAKLKRFATLGGGAAALAALPIASYASDALSGKETAERFARQEAEMWPRVGGGPGLLESNRGSYGFDPMQHIALADQLNKIGNLRRFNLLDATEGVKQFARGRGVDASSVASYAGSVAAFTGADGQQLNATLAQLRDYMVRGGTAGRGEEFMNRNLQILTRIAESQGGAITPEQSRFLMGMQTSLWSGASPVGKGQSGQSLMEALDSMFRGGGKSRGSQLFMWEALGGNEIKSADDYWRYKQRLDEGLSERNLKAYFAHARRVWGTDASGELTALGKMALQSETGLSTAQINLISRQMAAGKPFEAIGSTGSPEDDAQAALRSTRGGRGLAISAQKAANEMSLGAPLHSGAVKWREVDQSIRYKLPGMLGDVLRRPDADLPPENFVMGGAGAATRPLPAMPSWEGNLTPSEVRQAIEQGMDAALEKQRTRPTRVIIEGQSPATNANGSGY